MTRVYSSSKLWQTGSISIKSWRWSFFLNNDLFGLFLLALSYLVVRSRNVLNIPFKCIYLFLMIIDHILHSLWKLRFSLNFLLVHNSKGFFKARRRNIPILIKILNLYIQSTRQLIQLFLYDLTLHLTDILHDDSLLRKTLNWNILPVMSCYVSTKLNQHQITII